MAPMLRQRKAAPLLPLTNSGNLPLMTQQRIKRKTGILATFSEYVVYIPYVLFAAVVIGAIGIFTTLSTKEEEGVLHHHVGHRHQKHASGDGGRFDLHYSERGPRRRSAIELELSLEEERIRDEVQLAEEIMFKEPRTIARPDSLNEPAKNVEVDGERKGLAVVEAEDARTEGETALIDQLKHKSGKLKTITCTNGATGTLNDNYCDCADGSDETETSACSHVTVQQASFQCRDGSKAIYASRVGDGVKDCPDGSDEASI